MRELGSSDSGVPLTELQFLMSACKASMPRPVDLSIIFSLCQLSVYYCIYIYIYVCIAYNGYIRLFWEHLSVYPLRPLIELNFDDLIIATIQFHSLT